MSTNYLINDPVPRNVSKFPIHQTYLTDDGERTGNGGYKFKAPEVWSSARSGKKSIAVRSIHPILKRYELSFALAVSQHNKTTDVATGFEYFDYSSIVDKDSTLIDLLADIKTKFDAWQTDLSGENNSTIETDFDFSVEYADHTLTFKIEPDEDATYNYKITLGSRKDDTIYPAQSFNRFINQPLTFQNLTPSTTITYNNVWDHSSTLYFHASFIPFDNYQYLGELRDEWNNPIIYQDPNTSPLFNKWITSDLKTPFPI